MDFRTFGESVRSAPTARRVQDQFNPADGTLNGVLLSISGFGISAIRYTNSPGSGAIVVQTNAISVLANHSNVVFLTLAVADWTPGIMEKFVVPKFTSPPQAT